jgi:hypothetical protein
MFIRKPELIKEAFSYRLKKSKAHVRVYREVLRHPVELEEPEEFIEQ